MDLPSTTRLQRCDHKLNPKQITEALECHWSERCLNRPCDAVHDLDGFDSGDLSAETLIQLGKEAIDWWMPEARPHTTEQWQELLDDLDLIRELVAMIEHMAEMSDR